MIGTAIRDLRKQRKIKQKDLAPLVGISVNALCQIERNHTTPQADTLRHIAEALEIPVAVIHLMSIRIDDVPKNRRERFNLLFPTVRELMYKIFVD